MICECYCIFEIFCYYIVIVVGYSFVDCSFGLDYCIVEDWFVGFGWEDFVGWFWGGLYC